MNFGSIKPVILSTVSLGCGGITAVWSNQKEPFLGPNRVYARCTLSRPKPRGSVDEYRTDYDADQAQGEEMQDTVIAWREMVLSVQVISLDSTDAKDALGYLETLRARLRMRSYIDALAAVNVSFCGTLAIVNNDAPVDEHIASMATLDVRLTCTINEADPTRYGYIDEVTFEGITT